MLIDKEGNTTIIFNENKSFSHLIKNVHENYSAFKNDNIIVNLFSFDGLNKNDVLEFYQLSIQHRASKKSFVLVTDKVSYDEVPDDMHVVPTLQEAKDLIEMEEIERDLDL